MKNTTRRWGTLVAVLALAATMAACNGGDSVDDGTNAIDTGGTQTSPTDSPTGQAGGGTTLQIATPEGIVFDKERLEASANTEITVEYENDANIPHNIHFFEGEESSAESLGKTEVVTGPDAVESVTFTTPDAGTYLFLCDVHPAEMRGELVVS